jgi:hypothetical protein
VGSELCIRDRCGAELDVAAVPRPAAARLVDWLTCFPGFALVMAGGVVPAGDDIDPASVAACGTLTLDPSVRLLWPDGERTEVLNGPVVGLGPAATHHQPAPETGSMDPVSGAGSDSGEVAS